MEVTLSYPYEIHFLCFTFFSFTIPSREDFVSFAPHSTIFYNLLPIVQSFLSLLSGYCFHAHSFPLFFRSFNKLKLVSSSLSFISKKFSSLCEEREVERKKENKREQKDEAKKKIKRMKKSLRENKKKRKLLISFLLSFLYS